MSDVEQSKACPTCGQESALEDIGSASNRPYYRCPVHGQWYPKNPAAVELGRAGGAAAQASKSPEERSKTASDLATRRWKGEKLKKNQALS